jgi:hypothetical protein
MKVKMLVAGDELEYDVHEKLYFDPEHVFDEIGKQSGKLAWWHSLVALKDQEVEDFKIKLDKILADRELAYRGDSADLVEKYGKVTEGVIRAAVDTDSIVIEAKKHLNNLKREVGMLKAMAKGMDTRSVLLATAGSAQKRELETRLRSAIGEASRKDE